MTARPAWKLRNGPRTAAAVAGSALITMGIPVPAGATVVSPLTERYSATLYGDFLTIGNTVLGCPATAPDDTACAGVQSGDTTANNNGFRMRRVNSAADPALVFDASRGVLAVPAGATVVNARLFWGGNTGGYTGPSGSALSRCTLADTAFTPPAEDLMTGTPSIRVNGGGRTRVTPDGIVTSPPAPGPQYYTAEGEVTTAFRGVSSSAPMTVEVADVWAAEGLGCVAGWSLTAVYEYADPPAGVGRRSVHLYGGQVLQRSADPATTVDVGGFYSAAGAPARASVTAYEGDRRAAGDTFAVNGRTLAEPGTGATGNFFVSAADGSAAPAHVNNLSVDAKTVDLPAGTVPAGSGTAALTFATKGDTYVAQQVALSVPVPDLKVTKTASTASAAPGEKVGYTVTVENVGTVPYSGADLTDNLTQDLDDASYGWDLSADRGTFSYTGPMLHWQGDLAVGEKATVTYSVKVRSAGSGDGELRNNVVVAGGRSNCGERSEDPACRVLTRVVPAPESSASPTPSSPPSPTASASPSPSVSVSASPSPTATSSASPSPTATASASPAGPGPSAAPAPEPPAPGGEAVVPPPATPPAMPPATSGAPGTPVAGALPGTGAGEWLPALVGTAAVLLSVGGLLVLRTRRR